MKCNCEMWKDNYPMLENITMISSIHGVKWTGEFFKFCPWCGKAGVPSPHDTDASPGSAKNLHDALTGFPVRGTRD